jgi:uncharacterized protein (TIGR03546 family)
MLRSIAKLLKVLNSDADPGQISLGFCFAMVAGFTPLMSLHNLLVLLLVLVLRVNLSAFILGWGFFSVVSFALDPVFDRVGWTILMADPLKGLWSNLYNQTLWRIERFNNTVLMGSLLTSIILFFPFFLFFNLLIRRYRQHVLAWVLRSRIMKAFQASKVYQFSQAARGWGALE